MTKKRLIKLFLWALAGYLIFTAIFGSGKTYQFSFERENLKKVVARVLQQQEGKYAVFIKDLISKESFSQNENDSFSSASLYKLWVMAAAFEQIKQGKIKEDDPLVADVAALNKKFDFDKDEAEFQGGSIEFSIKSAINQMITISHNYAALALLDKIGNPSVPTKTTARDVAGFLEKLYQGEMIDQQYSQEMMDLLARQTINDRIPKYLPQGTKVAHKTGDIGFFEHDGGIVFSPKADFIIVVLSETKDPAEAADIIAKIARAVYDYFNI